MAFTVRDPSHPTLSATTEPSGAAIDVLLPSILHDVLGDNVDQDQAEHYLSEFAFRHRGTLDRLVQADTKRLAWLVRVFSCSRFLSEELLQHPDWLDEIPALHVTLSVPDYLERLRVFLQNEHGSDFIRAIDLAMFRRREILRIVIKDSLSAAPLAQLTEELSNLAEAILQRALTGVMREMSRRYGLPSDARPEQPAASFCVIALGKLGGRELNYSSDIDLMFVYGENGQTAGPEVISNREFYKKVANRYTDLLSTYTPEGLCYRVDLRLRPEGKLGEVCLSLHGAKEYYEKRARDWELQMLIKARVVAGDFETGHALLRYVEPAIYSTSTDFSTLETVAETRERLADKLLSRRGVASDLDVKLTRGGIRDIEFLVQCLQRLHGGRDEQVRHGGTIRALEQLLDRDLISLTEHSRLMSAYEYFRQLEHRLQFEDDRQTHTLPSGARELDRLAMCMPQGSMPASDQRPGTELLRQLNHYLEDVQAIYGRIVHAQRPLSYGPLPGGTSHDFPESPMPAPVADRPPEAEFEAFLTRVQALPPVAAALRRQPVRHLGALNRIWDQLESDSARLAAISSHPVAIDYLLQIVNVSPYFSEQLVRDITLVNEVMDVAENPNRRAAFEGLAAPLNNIDALRRFYRREMFRVQIGSICAGEPVFQTLDRTSALAEFMIARAYRIALERSLSVARSEATHDAPFVEAEGEMMVVALGRLGMREFDLGSDADLLFIIPDSEVARQKFWTRVAEHIIEILTAYTGDSVALSIDTRLRPNGREGLLVQTESTYTDYFAHHSEAWEGIAYMKARAVAGDLDRATTFLTHLQEVDWRRWGQSGRSRQDLKQMRLRLEREQGAASPLKAGSGGYYDADFALMFLRLKGAGLFFKSLNTPERIDIVEKMGHLERSDAEFLLRATTLYRAVDHAFRIASGHAEGKLPKAPGEVEGLFDLVNRWTASRTTAGSLEQELENTREAMRELFDRLFA